ncbi:hypothetical protein F0562_030059 [Nyssa sinensis]|uniref:Retrotransposon Copia-like N-terminal domain-containing protein n=1 Tax=Nyssa sinensis TaxID=561372 RepID=A0A5J5AYZ4_9ASTE|nr:hypothetical protein F0562_030059 [Nyssa sinensis]
MIKSIALPILPQPTLLPPRSVHPHHPPNSPRPKQYLNLNDPNNPFRLDHGDNPAVILVTDLLTADNDPTWSRAMRRALRAKNKLGFITNDIPRPQNPDDPLLDLWDRCNNIVVSWIQNSISSSIKLSVAFVDDAHEIWTDLQDQFSQQNGPLIFQLKKSLAGILQDNDSMSVYYGKFKTLWDELSIYDPIPVWNCGTMKTLVDRVFSLIQQQECQHSLIQHSPSPNTMALSINRPFLTSKMSNSSKPNPKKDRSYCTHYKITGRTLESCFKIGNAAAHVCSRCHMTGHTFAKCYKLHSYPPNHKFFHNPQPFAVLTTQSIIFPSTNLEAHNDDTVGLTKAQYQQLMALLQPRDASIAAQPSAN